MKSDKSYTFGVIFSLINCLSLGIVGITDKIGSSQTTSPLLFSTQSLLFSLLFSSVFASFYFKRPIADSFKKLSFSTWRLLLLVGIFASGFFILFRFLGLTQSTGTFATLSQVITTSLTALLAWVFLKERLSKAFWLLFLTIIIAIYFVSIGKFELASVKTGDLYILIGTLFLAIANIFARFAVQKVHPIVLSVARFFFGTLTLLLVTVLFLHLGSGLIPFSFISIVSGLLWCTNVITFNLAIKRIGVTLTTSLLMMAPVVTMVLEYFFLKHNFTSVQVIAAFVVMLGGLGIIFVNNRERLSS